MVGTPGIRRIQPPLRVRAASPADGSTVSAAAAAPAAPVGPVAPSPPAEAPQPSTAAPPVAVAVASPADAMSAVAPPPAPVALDPQPAPAATPAPTSVAAAPVPERTPVPAPAPPVDVAAPPVDAAAPPVDAAAPPVSAPVVGTPRTQPSASPTAAGPPPRSAPTGVVHEEAAVTEPSRPPDAVARPVAAASRPLTAADARRSSAVEPTRAPTAPQVVHSHSNAAPVFGVFGGVAVLLAGLVAAFLALRRVTTAPVREPESTPAVSGLAALDSYIHFDALLLDDADLLREQHAPHRACLHDLRRRHPRPSSEAARRRDVLPHRRRRARDEGVPGRSGAGPHGAGVRRLDRAELARAGAAAERASGLLHQDER